MNEPIKINLGAGSDIRPGYVNHDIAQLPSIDVVHNLDVFPWPWEDDSVDEILALDLLEHLEDFVPAMEEIHRILSKDGRLVLKVPYWNSAFRHIDPTHRRGFHEATFHFFDPSQAYCQLRRYYTKARFSIREEVFTLMPFAPYIKLPFIDVIRVRNRYMKRIIGFIGNIFSNVILDLDLVMTKLPPCENNTDMVNENV